MFRGSDHFCCKLPSLLDTVQKAARDTRDSLKVNNGDCVLAENIINKYKGPYAGTEIWPIDSSLGALKILSEREIDECCFLHVDRHRRLAMLSSLIQEVDFIYFVITGKLGA